MLSSHPNVDKTERKDVNHVDYEAEHVHMVYQQIAPHFSATRYKPWPIVERFLLDLPSGSIGLDVGCGNGKYLGINPNIHIIASDRSQALAQIASKNHSQSVFVADMLSLPCRDHAYDFVLSIAAIHHLSTRNRRILALKLLVEQLRPNQSTSSLSKSAQDQVPQLLVFVWALEQKGSRRGWTSEDPQDVLVPWIMKPSQHETKDTCAPPAKDGSFKPGQREISECASASRGLSRLEVADPVIEKSDSTVYHRYYHLYRKGELEEDIEQAGGKILRSGFDKDNWWAVATPKLKEDAND